MAVDIRYVGTRGVDQWSELNYNGLDLESNGFYEEFTNAMNNLQANNAAGGPRPAASPTSGRTAARRRCRSTSRTSTARTNVGDPARAYTGTTWTNTGLTNDMVFTNPSVERLGGRPGRGSDASDERDRRRSAGQLLRRQPGGRLRERPRQRRVQRLPRAPDRRPAPALARPARQRQLPVRARRWIGVPRVQIRPRDESDDQRPARHQDAVELDGPGRPRPALRHRHAPGAQRDSGQLGLQWRRTHPGRHGQHGQRAPRRHVGEGPPGDVQACAGAELAGDRHGVHVAGGRHDEHAPRVQRQRVVGERLQPAASAHRKAGTSRRPTGSTPTAPSASSARPAIARRERC